MLKRISLFVIGVLLAASAHAQWSPCPPNNGCPAGSYYDTSGNYVGVLTPTNIAGFTGFVPPTQDYSGIMAALKAAIASTSAKNVLFQDVTYNLGANYIPLVGGIGYKGVATRLGYANAGWVGKQHVIVGGSIFTGTGSYLFWDGALAISSSSTVAVTTQTMTTVAGSTNVTVTNGSLFTVGGRVYIPQGQTGGGFYTGIAYYVLSINGNVLTLALPDMVAIPAASTTTIQLSAGYPNDSTSRMSMTDIACDTTTNASNINTICIKMGAANTFGPIYSDFKHIFVDSNHTAHAVDFTNYNQCTFDDIATNYGDGQYYNIDIPGTTGVAWEPGNSWFTRLFNSNNGVGDSNFLQHNIQFLSQTGALANEIQIESLQATTAYISTQTTTTSALTNGSANIPVPNSALWPVGLPLWISTAANPNGFSTNVVYFVVSSSANVITLSNQLGGTAINSTGTATMVLNSQGNPPFVMAGIGTGTFNNAHGKGYDLEGNATMLMHIQKSTFQAIGTGQMETGVHAMVVGRGFSGSMVGYTIATSTDFDPVSNVYFWGQRGTTYQGYYGVGLWADTATASNAYALNLHTGLVQGFPDFMAVTLGTGNGWVKTENFVGPQVKTQDTSKTFGAINDATWNVFNGAVAQTYTLPAITNASTSNTIVGMSFGFINSSANNLAVATSSSQTIMNQSGVTAMTLAPGQWAKYTGAITVGGTLFWNYEGNAALMSHTGVIGAAPALTSCGTGSPTILGSDAAGTITEGTTASGCTVTFNLAYSAAPHCAVTTRSLLVSFAYTVSASAITITNTATTGDVIDYVCFGT